jgi:predicted SAM-dependent methyltransferase
MSALTALQAALRDGGDDPAKPNLLKRARLLRRRLAGANPRLLRDYLASAATPKLQIGGGLRLLDGWLNADIELWHGVYYLDAARPFPLPDAAFRYVFCEHMIEHVDFDAAASMLAECRRVLLPGGRVRIATPDLASLVAVLNGCESELPQRYQDFFRQHFIPPGQPATGAALANAFFRSWGHRFIYDEETLRALLEAAGFEQVVRRRAGESDDPTLQGLENEARYPPGLLDFESIVLEASA